MNEEIFIDKLINKLSINRETFVKKATPPGKFSDISFEELCKNIYKLETISKVSEKLLISVKTLRAVLYKVFPFVQQGNVGIKWKTELLRFIGYRRCAGGCKLEKPVEEFYNASSSKDGKSYVCKDCAKASNKLQRELKPEIIKASNRKRKALINGSFDDGADFDLIKAIYKYCPNGYHVDHIVPISKGGLHHEDNLCYLPALLNMQKQNKMPDEVPEIMKQAIMPNKERLYESIYFR